MSYVLEHLPVDAASPHVSLVTDALARAIENVPPEFRATVLRRAGWRLEEMRRELILAAARWHAAGERPFEAAIAEVCGG
jgi:hypothetical protein